MYIKGVNLGNWLVLEKWMSPGLFAGTTAEDEYYLPTQLPGMCMRRGSEPIARSISRSGILRGSKPWA